MNTAHLGYADAPGAVFDRGRPQDWVGLARQSAFAQHNGIDKPPADWLH